MLGSYRAGRAASGGGAAVTIAAFLALSCGAGAPTDEASETPPADEVASGFTVGDDGSATHRSSTLTASLPRVLEESHFQIETAGSPLRVQLVAARRGSSTLSPKGVRFHGAGPDGGDVVFRARPGVLEDFVEVRSPAVQHVDYRLDLDAPRTLRLVANTLELLDERGHPQLRVLPPRLDDAEGRRRAAWLEVDDCAVDRDPRAPWSRAPLQLSRGSCTLRVSWDGAGLTYPVWVDPQWASPLVMAAERYWHTATRLQDGTVLLAGGTTLSAATASAELFDPAANGGLGALAATGALQEATYLHTATLLGTGDVLVSGGIDGTVKKTTQLYSPSTGTWTVGSPLLVERMQHEAVLLADGDLLVSGGYTSAGSATASAERWTGASWTSAGAMPVAVGDHRLTLLGSGEVLMVGGGDNGPFQQVAALFDPVAAGGVGSFSTITPPLNPRADHFQAALDGNRVLIAATGTAVEVYDRSAGAGGTFTAVGTLMESRRLTAGVLFPGGNAVFAGGQHTSTATDTVEAFELDAALGSSRALTSLPLALDSARFTRLDGSTALLSGGRTTSGFSDEVRVFRIGQVGNTCDTGDDCFSSFCVDGVCCDTECTGSCFACSASAKGQGADGSCGEVAGGLDPHDDCVDSGSPACQANGLCDGAGQCGNYPVSSGCQPAACAKGADCLSGFCADGVCCDSACSGECEGCSVALKGFGIDGVCEAFLADTDPDDECMPDAGFPSSCLADGFCDGQRSCRSFAPTNVACGVAICADDNLVAPFCTGTGECSAMTAVSPCDPYTCAGDACTTSCSSESDCAAGAFCDANGVCEAVRASGEPCDDGKQCQSGACTDGVCCDRACDGICEACDVEGAEGSCVPVTGSPRGARPACPGGGECQQQVCNGVERETCAGFESGTECGASSCAGGFRVNRGFCDGAGACEQPAPTPCAPYRCANDVCATSCSDDDDCSAGNLCKEQECVPGGTCSEDSTTLIRGDGQEESCAPYLCRGNSCLEACTSTSDCADGTLCTEGRCQVTTTAKAGDSGGCSTSGRPSPASLWLLVLALIGLGRRCESRGSFPRPWRCG